MFRGRYQHTIDPKGRLSIPAKFRDVLARYEGGALVVVPDGECLEVYPVAEWERMESKLREQSRFSAEVREISRLYVSRARHEAALDKNVTLVGGGLDKFEVWDRGRFEEYDRTGQPKLPSLYDKLASLG